MRIVQLTKGYSAIVDDVDYPSVSQFKWYAHPSGKNFYAVRNKQISPSKRVTEIMSRFLLGVEHGKKIDVDHINRNTLDNRRSNLRLASRSQNICNTPKKRYKNSLVPFSKFKGVYRNSNNRFRASIVADGKRQHIGTFDNERDAALCYNLKSYELHGEFSLVNTEVNCG